MSGTVRQVGEEAMHPGAEGRKVVIFFVHFEKEIFNRNLLEVFSLLSTSNCYYSNGFRAR